MLLAAPLSGQILRTLADTPRQQAELRREVGAPAQTTLRAQLRRLSEAGAIAKRRRDRFPGVLEHSLTPAGRELLFVAAVLERWLERAPQGPLALGDGSEAKAAIQALAEGWSTTMLRALAAGPLSLTELDRVIGSLSYPSLERRLGAMRLAGQVEAQAGDGRGTPYTVTDWLRRGVAPLLAAMSWEHRRRSPDTTPIARIDIEAALLLAVPLLQPAAELSGSCRLVVEVAGDGPAGVTAELRGGQANAQASEPNAAADARVAGSLTAWLEALIERRQRRLELGGKHRLARAVVAGLHEALFEASRDPLPIRP